MDRVRQPSRPAGLRRLLFRLPVHLYRMGLGRLLGGRFLLLEHVGRVSGKVRRTVIEVVEHDQESDGYIVASGYGRHADWYRNVVQTPDVTITVGARRLAATATVLDPAEGAEAMVRYAHRHPVAARWLAPRLLGFRVDGSDARYREVGREVPFLRLTPRAVADTR